MKTALKIGTVLITLIAGVGWGAYYLTHNVDWVRVYYKRFKAADKYVFEEISPYLTKTDPAKLIRIRTRNSAEQIRGDLVEVIWGDAGMPLHTQPKPRPNTAWP